MRSQAVLKGSLLYVDGRLWADDVTIDEAAELLVDIAGRRNAPTWVYVDLPKPRIRRKSQTGWPKS